MANRYLIHPIPLVSLSKPMSQQVYRMASSIGESTTAYIYVWYIEGSEKKILVDCGCTEDMLLKAGAQNVTHIQTLEKGLARWGLKPENIDVVIETHLHFDHISLAKAFTKAKFFVQQAELDYQYKPDPPPVDPRPCSVELLDKLNWEIVKGDYEVEKGLNVLFTPGHTPGGQSVAIETDKGLAILDSLCTTDSNWDVPAALQSRFEFFIPDIHNDPLQAYESLKKIKKMADIIFPLHEPRFAKNSRNPE